ncbi:MAG: hypothetical protein Q7K40_03905 [bacterium]|nr:hypothetical protein [bacterium]
MFKIYVAGKNLKRAQSVMEMLKQNGHTITFDWVTGIENEKDEDQPQRAIDERAAVQQADLLVYLWESDQESARYEAGMAMGLNKRIIVSGFKSKLFFLSLPEVTCVESDMDILSALS